MAGTSARLGLAQKLPVAAVGDHVALYRIGVAVKSGSRVVEVNSDYLFLTKGRTQFFVNLISPSNVEGELKGFENRIAKTLAARGT